MILDYLSWVAAFSRGSAFNYPIPFLFDLRGALTLILLGRALLSRKAVSFFTLPTRNLGAAALSFFLLFYVAGHLSKGNFVFIRELAILTGTALVVYFYHGNNKIIRGILFFYIIGCMLTALETILGVMRFGNVPHYHIFSQALGLAHTGKENHNIFGFTSMVATVLLMVILVNARSKAASMAALTGMLICMAAVFFSTSRSAILGLLFSAGWVVFFYYRMGRIRMRTGTVLIVVATPFVLGIALYATVATLGLDILRYRLVNEPLAALGIGKGIEYADRSYNYVDKAESIAGREHYARYIMNRIQQEPLTLFIGGKVPGMELSAHTMFLNVLTDAGLFGLFAYLSFMICVVGAFLKYAGRSDTLSFYFFPMIAVWVYCQGQNREFMYPIMFAFTGGFFRELELIKGTLASEKSAYYCRPSDQRA